MKKPAVYAFLLCLVVLAVPASAKYITMTHELKVEKVRAGEETSFNLTIQNYGDEPAYDVQVSLLVPEGIETNQVYLGRVDPGMPRFDAFKVETATGLKPGKYAMAVLTEYKDANGYPFSSTTPNYLVVNETLSSGVSGTIDEVSIGDTKEKKKLTLSLRNMDAETRTVMIRIFSPKELSIAPAEDSVLIGPRSQAVREFDISSFGALAGSNYVVFASMEYEDEGLHYSSTAGGMVKIVKYAEKIGGDALPPLPVALLPIIAGGLLVLAVVAVQLFHSRKKK